MSASTTERVAGPAPRLPSRHGWRLLVLAVVVLTVLIVATWGVAVWRDWRAGSPYRAVAQAKLDQIGTPPVPGARPTASDTGWPSCRLPTCGVAVRSWALPAPTTVGDLRTNLGRWLGDAGVPLTTPRFIIPFGEPWWPACQVANVPGAFRCFTSAGLPRISPRQIVYVWVRFTDPNHVHVVKDQGTIQPDLGDRIAEVSVAVLADNGRPGTT